jgi:hypothetical protein
LTKRQRELLQQYADEVEGRKVSQSDESTTVGMDPLSSSSLKGRADEDNGMATFTSLPPSPPLVSRIWQRIRGFVGI